MDYLQWIKALDKAQQYASMNGTVLTSLHLSGAVFSVGGYLSHDDILAELRAGIIGQNGNSGEHYPADSIGHIAVCNASNQYVKTSGGYSVYRNGKGWVETDTLPPEIEEFFNERL